MSERNTFIVMGVIYFVVAGIISFFTSTMHLTPEVAKRLAEHGASDGGVLKFTVILLVALAILGLALAPAFLLLQKVFEKQKAPVWLAGLEEHFAKITGGKSDDRGGINSILTVTVLGVLSAVMIAAGTQNTGVLQVTAAGVIGIVVMGGGLYVMSMVFGAILKSRKAPFVTNDVSAREKELLGDAKPAETMELQDTTVIFVFLTVVCAILFVGWAQWAKSAVNHTPAHAAVSAAEEAEPAAAAAPAEGATDASKPAEAAPAADEKAATEKTDAAPAEAAAATK
jgi:hypothetical protein